MKQASVHSLNNALFFMPKKPWPPSLPPVAWNGYLIAGWDSSAPEALVADGNLEDLMLQLYSDLDLSELARLYDKLTQLPKRSFSFEKLMAGFGLRFSSRLEKCFAQILKLNPEAQAWIDEKKLKPSDLEILNCFVDVSPIEALFSRFTTMKPSKQQGVEILELFGELVLAGEPDIPMAAATADLWLLELRRRRFPMREAHIDSAQKKIASLSWPQRTKAQLKKFGDQDLLEISFQAASASDFQKKLAQLAQMQKTLEEVRLWTSEP